MKRTIFCCALMVILVGCSHQNESTSASLSPNPKNEQAQNNDLGEPLSSYMDVSNDPKWPVKWYFANNTKYTDEDVMNALEPGYYHEQNAFKKHDMMQKDLDSLKQQFAKFKGVNFVKFTNISATGQMPDAPFFFNGYDFTTQTFKLSDALCIGGQSSGGIADNTVWWTPTTNKEMCFLKISDQPLAQQIEGARQKMGIPGGLFITGTTYAKVLGFQGAGLQLQATHVHYDIGLRTSYLPKNDSTPLAKIDI